MDSPAAGWARAFATVDSLTDLVPVITRQDQTFSSTWDGYDLSREFTS